MNNNILIIIGSARKNGNTSNLINIIFKRNPNVTILNLLDYKIEYYNYENHYTSQDQFKDLTDAIINHQHIILATPIYWHAMSAIMKTFIERFNELLLTDKARGRQFKGKTLQLISLGTSDNLPENFSSPFFYLSNYLEMEYKGYFYFKTEEQLFNEEQLDEIRKSFLN